MPGFTPGTGDGWPRYSQMIRNKLEKLLGEIFLQGASPRKLALMVSLGLIIGIFPMVWGGTLLCMAAAFLLRLNQAGIQAVNYLAYPLQIALFVPFYRLGSRFFPWVPKTSNAVLGHIGGSMAAEKFMLILLASLKAAGVWLIMAPLGASLIYFCLLPLFTRLQARRAEAVAE